MQYFSGRLAADQVGGKSLKDVNYFDSEFSRSVSTLKKYSES
jgi:hypothetical protein